MRQDTVCPAPLPGSDKNRLGVRFSVAKVSKSPSFHTMAIATNQEHESQTTRVESRRFSRVTTYWISRVNHRTIPCRWPLTANRGASNDLRPGISPAHLDS